MWSFGCVVYELVTGTPLWRKNRNDDLPTRQDLEALAAWDAACVAEFPDEKLLDWAANGGDF